MSSVRSGPFDQKNITYIVTGASLVNDLVTYTQSLSAALVQTGTFAAHANAALVTQGYLLVDTGKRLVPGQQPNVPTLLIGVNAIPMDTSGRRLGSFAGTTATTISGFIDPNSPNVAIYSRDRPTTFNDNLYFSGAANLQAAGDKMTNASLLGSSGATDFTAAGNGAGVRHRGPGVYSGGTLTASGGSTLTATVTGAAAASGVFTYTSANTFAVGQTVQITGFTGTSAGFNITGIIASRSASQFTVMSAVAANITTITTATATAAATLTGIVVGGGGQTITSGALTLSAGPFIQTPVPVATASLLTAQTASATLDASLGNFFIITLTSTGTPAGNVTVTLTVTNSAPGTVLTVVLFNNTTGTVAALLALSNTSALSTPALTTTVAQGARGLYTVAVYA